QGIGWALTEEYVFKDGVLQNPTLLDYRIPTAMDLPMIDTHIVEVPAADGPYGVRGVGEVPIVPPPAAVANAIYRAVGVRMQRLPVSRERVGRALLPAAAGEALPVPRVRGPSPMRPAVGGQQEVDVEGANGGEVLRHLAATYPQVRDRLLSPEGGLQAHLMIA